MVKKLTKKLFEERILKDLNNGLDYDYVIQINDDQDEEYLINFIESLGFSDRDYWVNYNENNKSLNIVILCDRLYRFIILRSGIDKTISTPKTTVLIKLKKDKLI